MMFFGRINTHLVLKCKFYPRHIIGLINGIDFCNRGYEQLLKDLTMFGDDFFVISK